MGDFISDAEIRRATRLQRIDPRNTTAAESQPGSAVSEEREDQDGTNENKVTGPSLHLPRRVCHAIVGQWLLLWNRSTQRESG